MINDPNDLYDGGPKPKAPLPKPSSSEGYLAWRGSAAPNMQHVGSSFKVDGVTSSDQKKFFGDTGIYDPALTEQNIAIEAGNRQSFGNKLVRRAANLVPNIAASLVDMLGNAGSLLTEWGDERDYHNVLNDVADSMKDPAGQNYRRSNDTWALSDPTWWIDNIGNLAEMGVGFGVGGLGVAKLMTKAGEGVTAIANLGAKGSKWLSAAQELGTSGLLSYAEAAQAGTQVYSETYESQRTKFMAQGFSPEEANDKAKHIAAQSAATASQLGTLLTMGINAGAFTPYFKSAENEALDVITRRIAQSESKVGLGATLRGMNAADYADKLFNHNNITHHLKEMFGEGAEEVLQQFAQQTGTDMGNDDKTKGFFEQFGELEHLIDRTANSQGMLSFTLGAAFGGIQNLLIHNVFPSKHVDRLAPDGTPIQKLSKTGEPITDANGMPVMEKTWVTPRKHEYDFTKQKFDNLKESVAADFDNFDKASTDILAAVGKKDQLATDEARDRLFDSGKIHAVKSGITEPWVKTFEQIAGYTPEKAQELGYGDDYKERAEQSVKDIRHLSETYDALSKRYDLDRNEHLEPFVDMVFARQADLYSTDNRIKQFRTGLDKAELEEKKMAELTNPGEFSELINKYTIQHNSAREVERQLLEDHTALLKGDLKVVARLLSKYRATGFGDGNTAASVKDLDTKLRDKQTEQSVKVKAAEDNLLNSPDYLKWLDKHPDGKFNQFLSEVNQRNNLSVQNRAMRAQLEAAEATHDIAKQNLADMTSDKSIRKFTGKVTEWMNSMRDQTKAIEADRVAKLAADTKDQTTLERLAKIEQNRIAEGYRAERDKAYQTINSNNEQVNKLKEELSKLKSFDPIRSIGLNSQIKRLQEHSKKLALRGAQLDSLFNKTKVDTTIDPAPKEVEDVTGEQNGKVTDDASNAPTTVTIGPLQPIFVPVAPSVQGTPEDITTPIVMSLTTPPVDSDDYSELYKGITSVAVKTSMNRIINGFFDNSIGFSLDLLNKEIAAGVITQAKATKLLYKAWDYVIDVESTLDQLNELADGGTIEDSELEKELDNFDVEITSSVWDNYNWDLYDDVNGVDNVPVVVDKNDLTKWQSVEGILKGNKISDEFRNDLENILNGINAIKAKYAEPTDTVEVTGIDYPSTPVITNADEVDPSDIPINGAYHAGYKIVNAASTGATSTIAYEEGTRKDKTGKTVYYKIAIPDKLNPELNPDILTPGKLMGGTDILYQVDTEYDGEKNITDSLSWDDNGDVIKERERAADYLTVEGKVASHPRNIGNVPIKVLDAKTGKLLFHIRKLDWLEAKFPGTEDYRNVVDIIHTKDGDEIPNLDNQRVELMNFRSRIIEKFNHDGKPMEGKISPEGKGTGRLILNNIVAKGNVGTSMKAAVKYNFAVNKTNPEKSLLPDKSLKIVITDDSGVIYEGRNFEFTGQLGFDPYKSNLVKGGVGAMVPSANGSYLYAPLTGVRIVEGDKPSAGLNSITRAIELFLLNDGSLPDVGAEINNIQSNTGFNIATAKGLKAFINQYYTYSQFFQDSILSPGVVADERFLFHIEDGDNTLTDKTRQVKIGFTGRGDGVQYADLVNGVLTPAFVQTLKDGLATRSRAVVYTDAAQGLKGINSTGSFKDAIHIPGKGWKFNDYENYNEYVKSFSKTAVYGRNQLPNGQYVYTANPQLPIDTSGPDLSGAFLIDENSSAQSVTLPKTEEETTGADMFDNLFNQSIRPLSSQIVPEMGTGSEESTVLSVQRLQEIYNFTTEAQRNGKTVLEVFNDLSSRGHSYISEGFNPFSRCL